MEKRKKKGEKEKRRKEEEEEKKKEKERGGGKGGGGVERERKGGRERGDRHHKIHFPSFVHEKSHHFHHFSYKWCFLMFSIKYVFNKVSHGELFKRTVMHKDLTKYWQLTPLSAEDQGQEKPYLENP